MSEKFSSKTSFIMASVGSAVGLGNIFRFPALAVGYGIIYIIVYAVLLFAAGLPLLLSELALGRKFGGSAVKSFSSVKPKYGFIGWLCCGNSFIIMTYYCLLFSFVLLAAVFSYRLINTTPQSAAVLFPEYLYPEGFPVYPLLFLIVGWAAVILCFGSAERLGKISTAGVIFASLVLGTLALIRGFSQPEQLLSFCRLEPTHLLSSRFWCDALGQVFFSLSVMVGVMPAYGSFLDKKESIASSGLTIALFDLAVSLAATVIYATVAESGDEGLLACFSVYPKAFMSLTSPLLGAQTAFLFYLSLALLCLDSVFSYLKSISSALFERLGKSETVIAVVISLISAFLGFFMLGRSGRGIISHLDGRITPLLTLITGLFEVAVFAELAKSGSLIKEINLGSKRGYSALIYRFSVCILSPAVIILLVLSQILF